MIAAPDRPEAEEHKGTCVRRPCRVYHLWPELKVFKSRRLNIASLSNHNREIYLYIQTFLNRPTFSVPAQSLSDDLGPSHVRLGKDVGFWLGNVVVGDRGESPSSIRRGAPLGNAERISRYQGEIDIGIMLGNIRDDGAGLINIAGKLIDIAIPFLATALNDYLFPIAVAHVDEWSSTDRKLISPQTIRLEGKDRDRVSVDLLTKAFDGFCSLIDTMRIEDLRGLAVASRRLNNATLEDDIIDKYCDLWECCEFLAPSGRKVNEIRLPKAKDAAIIQLLCSYVKPSNPRLIIKRVCDIYSIRNDLVHNAIENLEVVDKNLRLLREIAIHLFRYRVGIPFAITPELVPLL
jgi:hypothetical protein